MTGKFLRATPKVFGSSYRPPVNKSRAVSWRPVVTAFIILVSIFLISRLPIFRINTIVLTGSVEKGTEEIIERLKGESIFSSEIKRVELEVLQRFSNISAVDCRRGLPSTLRCQISLRSAKIIWQSGSIRLAIDEHGYLFELKETDGQLPIIEDINRLEYKVGTQVISSELVALYFRLLEGLQSKQIEYQKLLVGESLYQPTAIVNISPEKEIRVLFSITSPLDYQLNLLKKVLGTKTDQISQYVDLRVGGYVYYQ